MIQISYQGRQKSAGVKKDQKWATIIVIILVTRVLLASTSFQLPASVFGNLSEIRSTF